MEAKPKRTMVTVSPELEVALDQLKKDRFYKGTMAEMYRYVIAKGLEAIMAENDECEKSGAN